MVNIQWELAGFADDFGQIGVHIPTGNVEVPSEIFLAPDETEVIWSPCLCLGEDGQPGANVVPGERRREPLETWCYYSKRAYSVLNIAAALKLDRPGVLDDWENLRGAKKRNLPVIREMHRGFPFRTVLGFGKEYPFDCNGFGKPEFERSAKTERFMLMGELMYWLTMGRVRFVVFPVEKGWNLEVHFFGGLLGAVAMQLALLVANIDALYTCSGCGRVYGRPEDQKRPNPGQANFCPQCRDKGEPLKQADKRRRERMARAREMDADGKPGTDIAAALNTTVSSVQRWLKGRKA
ncbi:MAG: hypothetical protein NTY38_32200 [Acidobacteria bacterium]|nr:hypothetical protein [Acidobacteriota bacterium]